MAKKIPLTVNQLLGQEIEVFKKQSRARSQIAEKVYATQDTETREAIDSMTERIVSISRGVALFTVKGKKIASELPTETIEQNARYLATEILKDLAMLDIRVGNFRFDPRLCAVCSKDLASKVKKKR